MYQHRKKPSSGTRLPKDAQTQKEFGPTQWDQRGSRRQREEPEPRQTETAADRELAEKRAELRRTHVLPDQRRRPDAHRHRPIPIVHDHSKAYYEYLEKQGGKKKQIERDPRPDLFDFDNPQSDSDYDDMDEYTGIYHDDDPMSHPA